MSADKTHLTLEHMRFIKDGIAFIQTEESVLYKEAKAVPYERLFAVCEDDFGWSYLYECPINQVSILYFSCMGLIPIIQEQLRQGVEINQAIMNLPLQSEKHAEDYLDKAFDGLGNKPTIEEIKSVRFGLGNLFQFSDLFSLSYALLGHLSALRKFGKDMSQFVEDVRNGVDESFFHAVRIDPTVLACAPFAKRMSMAKLQDDSEFFRLVGNALKVKWKKPKLDLDSLRVILHGLNDTGQLDDLSQNEADALFIQKLQVYSDTGDDPSRSLYRFIQRYKNNK